MLTPLWSVTATCVGTAATHQARLSCVHSAGTDGARWAVSKYLTITFSDQGRQPPIRGTVCGHYWDNDNLANIAAVRRQADYTFGKTDFLPTLPVVAG